MNNLEKLEVIFPKRPFNAQAPDFGWREHLTTPGIQPGIEGLLPNDTGKRLREVANYIDQNTDPFPPDPNVFLALKLAAHLGPLPQLPPAIGDMSAEERADLILQVVDKEPLERLPTSRDDLEPFTRIATFIGRIADMTQKYMPNLSDLVRISVILRLWAGCLHAEKTVAIQTNSGGNTAAFRESASREIDRIASGDPVYAAGVEAAVAVKMKRGERISFEGVPKGTRVFKLKPVQPQDEWERRLLGAASHCGVSLSHLAVSSEGLYE